ncbi:MAG: cobyric acid synthase [Candidatus Omnitrophica bacterium]|nr:cobyric acid synthase [Candidatus Omnitrophota bacterium]
MKKRAKVIQICGTGSGVGKSIFVAGLCRIYQQQGYKVAPFKAQNMALNSAVTPDGLEIGCAQAVQALACKVEPSVDMNPVLLKPTSDVGSQVILSGRPLGNMTAGQYYKCKTRIFATVKKSVYRLLAKNDIVVVEGAGSPAEINLKKHDIVNMRIARLLSAPVLLVGDINSGGVFAWLLGTLALLTQAERKLVKGFVINKFRGDKKLLKNGLDYLQRKSKKRVFGVLPYYKNIAIPEEDSLFFDQLSLKQKRNSKQVHIVVIRIPHISNFTDFDIFRYESDVCIEFSRDPQVIEKADCIILPGTKNTLSDLDVLFQQGLAELIKKKAQQGCFIVGVCGGFQMLGRSIVDRVGVEGTKGLRKGLELLAADTYFKEKKDTYLIEGIEIKNGMRVKGYEIHHGKMKLGHGVKPLFLIKKRGNRKVCVNDGVSSQNGRIWGTYIHGIFDNSIFRKEFLNKLRRKKKLKVIRDEVAFSQDEEFNKLADLIRENVNMKMLNKTVFNKR